MLLTVAISVHDHTALPAKKEPDTVKLESRTFIKQNDTKYPTIDTMYPS